MNTREFGRTGKKLSLLGFGMLRFPDGLLRSEAGLDRCAELLRYARSLGVNYFDTAHTYAQGLAREILRRALPGMPGPVYIVDKSIITKDATSDAVRRRIDESLRAMGISRLPFFAMWAIMNEAQYRQVMAPGGPYEGAFRAKSEGLIEHIVFSTHATAEENLRILRDGAFEGITLSFNAVNAESMLPVVRTARELGVGVAAMNPLGGGMIAANPKVFAAGLQNGPGISPATAALRYVASFPEVTVVLSGMATAAQAAENAKALSGTQEKRKRATWAWSGVPEKLCTGCGDCAEGCPGKAPLPAYMQAYNQRYFPQEDYLGVRVRFRNVQTSQAHAVFRALRTSTGLMPETGTNPCVHCGQCERVCPQGIDIMKRMKDFFALSQESLYSVEGIHAAIEKAVAGTRTGRVGVYPAGSYARGMLEFVGKHPLRRNVEWHVYDRDPGQWGQVCAGTRVESPQGIVGTVDTVVVAHYILQEEILGQLAWLRNSGVNVVGLNEAGSVPYFG